MRKRLISVALILLIILGVGLAGKQYYRFVSEMIYQESTAHLTEIYHQANQNLGNLVANNWSTLRMWVPYLRDAQSDAQVEAFVRTMKAEKSFTDFYFISRNGEYRTVNGKSGYLDLKEHLSEVILDGKNAVVSSVVPNQP